MGDSSVELRVRIVVGANVSPSALLLLPEDIAVENLNLPSKIGDLPVTIATVGPMGMAAGTPGNLAAIQEGVWQDLQGWSLSLQTARQETMATVMDMTGWLSPILKIASANSEGGGANRELRVLLPLTDGSVFTIGRSQRYCDLVLEDQHVSSEHLRIEVRGSKHLVSDLNSKWGTHLDGVKLEGTKPLFHGAEILIGETRIRFECIRDALATRDISITQMEPSFKPEPVLPKAPPRPKPLPVPQITAASTPTLPEAKVSKPPTQTIQSNKRTKRDEPFYYAVIIGFSIAAIVLAVLALLWIALGGPR